MDKNWYRGNGYQPLNYNAPVTDKVCEICGEPADGFGGRVCLSCEKELGDLNNGESII